MCCRNSVNGALDEVRWQVNQAHERVYKRTDKTVEYKSGKRSIASSYSTSQSPYRRQMELAAQMIAMISAVSPKVPSPIPPNTLSKTPLTLPFFTCGGVLKRGGGLCKRLGRAERYLKLAGEEMYIRISELSEKTGWTPKKLGRDIRTMIESGMFPEGHMDEKNDIFG